MQMNLAIDFKTYDPLIDIPAIESIWSHLLPNCNHSFFLSFDWIFTWLSSLPDEEKTTCVVGYMSNEPVLAFFIGKRKIIRNKVFYSRNLYVNSTGSDYYDELTIEYNSILISSSINDDISPIVWSNIIKFLNSYTTWDELYIPGATEQMHTLCSEMIKIHNETLKIVENKNVHSYYVDLKKIRANGMDYISLLSSNKRSQIRRSIKEFEKNGEIKMSQASSIKDAISMLNGLAELHQQEWVKRDEVGSFSNTFFYKFHKQLIENSFEKGSIQLLKFSNDSYTIGYIYNYIYEKNVLFYQCGFNYFKNNKIRPGIVSHYLASLHNAKMNYNKYDFLAGNAQYKKSLSTDANKMLWLMLQKNRKKFFFERILKNIKNSIK